MSWPHSTFVTQDREKSEEVSGSEKTSDGYGVVLAGGQGVISCILCDSLCLLVGNYSLVADDTLCSHTQTRIRKHPHAPSGQICSVFMESAVRDSMGLLWAPRCEQSERKRERKKGRWGRRGASKLYDHLNCSPLLLIRCITSAMLCIYNHHHLDLRGIHTFSVSFSFSLSLYRVPLSIDPLQEDQPYIRAVIRTAHHEPLNHAHTFIRNFSLPLMGKFVISANDRWFTYFRNVRWQNGVKNPAKRFKGDNRSLQPSWAEKKYILGDIRAEDHSKSAKTLERKWTAEDCWGPAVSQKSLSIMLHFYSFTENVYIIYSYTRLIGLICAWIKTWWRWKEVD